MTVSEYKEWYKEHYGVEPSEKMVDKFCEANRIGPEERGSEYGI